MQLQVKNYKYKITVKSVRCENLKANMALTTANCKIAPPEKNTQLYSRQLPRVIQV